MIKHIMLAIVTVMLLTVSAQAAREKQTFAMSLKVFKKVEEINLLVEENNEAEALILLDEALENKRLTKYEQAQLWYLRGTIIYKTKGEAASISEFAKVLEFEGNIPVFLHMRVLKTLVQLNLVQEHYEKAREYGIQLVTKSEVPKAEDYALLAQANYKLEDWQAALDACEEARKIYVAGGKIPKENLLLLQNAVYFELKDMPKMIETLELVIKHYPKPTYVMFLASIHGQMDRLDKQTVLMESLYEDGQITESSQLVNLASLYMSQKVPYKAAILLEENIESGMIKENRRNYEMLAQAWRLAAELQPSVNALAKAAEFAEDGELYVRKAYIHYDMAQWQEAEKAIFQAFDKGVEDETKGEAWLLLGMTRFNMNAFDKAIAACEEAVEYPDSKSLAQRWITYISREEDKYNAMRGYN